MDLPAQQPQHEQHERIHAARPSKSGVRWSDERDDGAVGLQNLEGFLKRFARDGAENGIVIPQHVFKFLLLVIDHLICSEAPYQVRVSGAGGCRHFGTEILRELDRERANASSACGNEYLLTCLDLCSLLSACHEVSPTIGTEAAWAKLARLLTLVAEDVVFLTPGQAPFGREGFSSTFMAAHQQMRISCTSELEEVVVVGEVAYTRSRDALSVTPRAGGKTAQLAGHR